MEYDWRRELAALCGGVFNLDPFDWSGFDSFVLSAYRMGATRPSAEEFEAAVRTLKPTWATTLAPAYQNGVRLLQNLAAMPPATVADLLEEGRQSAPEGEAGQRAVEAAERLLRGDDG